MNKMVRISVLSASVLTAMAFSAFNALAMPIETGAGSPAASATSASEIIGTVTALDATSITIDGTVYPLTAAAQIQGAVQVGDLVKLEIVVNADGSVTVREVAKPDSSVDVSTPDSVGADSTSAVEPTETPDPAHVAEAVHAEASSSNHQGDQNFDQSGKDAGNTSGGETGASAGDGQ